MKKITYILIIAGLTIVGVAGFKILGKSNVSEVTLETSFAEVGDVSTDITATGTIEAIKTVEVGTQVSGVIEHIYVDFNDQVMAGQLIAQLDKTSLNASMDEAQASLASAQSEYEYQKANYLRNKQLFESTVISQADYDEVLYYYKKSEASVKSAQAQLKKVQISLGYASIYAPIDGIVTSRSVDEGQTVAASFSTPTLFTIANDLTKMQVEADVDEADIGQVKVGQNAIFTVDAYPESEFKGTVTQIRLEPQINSNVVTYTVIMEAPNPKKELMPGMTASISVLTQEAKGALTISAKALRFKPDPELMEAYQPAPSDKEKLPPNEDQEAKDMDETMNVVWVKSNNQLKPARIKIGVNDGSTVEVQEGLDAGDEVVLSMKAAAINSSNSNKDSEQTSPFMPQRPGAKKKD